jgi:hypothetical protein
VKYKDKKKKKHSLPWKEEIKLKNKNFRRSARQTRRSE